MSAKRGSNIGDLDLGVEISGYVRKCYRYEVFEREMIKKSTIDKRKRGKWNRGSLYRNTENWFDKSSVRSSSSGERR